MEDDWEVQGNGLGNVASHQYLPSLFMMKLCKRLNVKMTFMVEVVQQLIYNRNINKDYNFKLQKNLWDDNIILMKEYGFDVQLHLHPQWGNPEIKDEFFLLSKQWNIGMYDKEFKSNLIKEAIDYLENLLRPYDPNYKVIAYKAGSWGLQPSGDLFNSLAENGVKIVMGVRKDMKIPNIGLDYTTLEEGALPYYPQFEDINRVSAKKEPIVVLPLQPYSADLVTLFKLGVDAAKNKLARRDSVRHFYEKPIPSEIDSLSPLFSHSKLKPGLRPYPTHLKIGNHPLSFLKASFKDVINRLKDVDSPRVPIVIECHTKLFPNYYSDIEKFLLFIQDKYGDIVDFGDMTSFYKELEANPSLVKMKASAN